MLSRRIFETEFAEALQEELARQDMSIRELAERAGIPPATLYKLTSGRADPRLSTVRRIVNVLEPREKSFIAVIAARFLLDDIDNRDLPIGEKKYHIRGYPADSLEECIAAAARAEKEGALGIVCAPILASIVEKIVDCPVAIIKPQQQTIIEAIETIAKRV
ncbi:MULTISPECIES: helix-turn-helix domain-containing protein [unclassified Methanoculleus]|uniref:helix-turn-helix domain-containing protein n=1 Tax=unclassified Methanoculleus TaxID=2619537 RepID=UPI0025EAC6D2|nr:MULTISPECIES: helix-turn-helix domain-containing protein [unclassified Methanoculleus]MCK9317988.1 helix-turn-helix domain-containing protein [Methanoculleus sp.]MDD2254084.1 helix-turn-helix domain-containing protein [Methanoculleus sp.]MDD2786885.1 helix-turn-helix domain-containing protein [Methanoculleus sp.]MDD3215357.1 helix-turn-helix domain-containing protein [Methanoculleus sp.]MDD4314318.1 helix-turn-helix domain-containing protein [Methanoculleus sp.]